MSNPRRRKFPEELGHELVEVLESGTAKEKEHILLNIAMSGDNTEDVLDLFISYTTDPEMEVVAYVCIARFLENSRHYSLLKVLPLLIDGLAHEQEAIRNHCQSGLDNLVSPAKLKEETLNFESFEIAITYDDFLAYLSSDAAQEIIIALLYAYHQPHKDEELFKMLDDQLRKNIPAVNCVAGAIIDSKLSHIIGLINTIGELSLASYNAAKASGLKSRAFWVYDRFDSIRELAREHMKVMLAERQTVR
jgi:hypothetical protein